MYLAIQVACFDAIFDCIANMIGRVLSKSYTMVCPHVRGDNPRALASGLSYVLVDNMV